MGWVRLFHHRKVLLLHWVNLCDTAFKVCEQQRTTFAVASYLQVCWLLTIPSLKGLLVHWLPFTSPVRFTLCNLEDPVVFLLWMEHIFGKACAAHNTQVTNNSNQVSFPLNLEVMGRTLGESQRPPKLQFINEPMILIELASPKCARNLPGGPLSPPDIKSSIKQTTRRIGC